MAQTIDLQDNSLISLEVDGMNVFFFEIENSHEGK